MRPAALPQTYCGCTWAEFSELLRSDSFATRWQRLFKLARDALPAGVSVPANFEPITQKILIDFIWTAATLSVTVPRAPPPSRPLKARRVADAATEFIKALNEWEVQPPQEVVRIAAIAAWQPRRPPVSKGGRPANRGWEVLLKLCARFYAVLAGHPPSSRKSDPFHAFFKEAVGIAELAQSSLPTGFVKVPKSAVAWRKAWDRADTRTKPNR